MRRRKGRRTFLSEGGGLEGIDRPALENGTTRSYRPAAESGFDDVPAPTHPDTFDKRRPDPNVLLPWLEQQGFKSLLSRFTGELGEATAPIAPPSRPALPAPAAVPALPAPTATPGFAD